MNFDNNLETDYSTILKERDDLSKERDDLLKERDNLFKKQQNDLFKEQNNINELYNKLDELLRKQNVFKSINKKQNIVEFESFDENLIPEIQTEGASAADIKNSKDIELLPESIEKIPTGVKIKNIKEGFGLQIRPRGSTSFKNLEVIYGTIDNDFTGEIFIKIRNFNKEVVTIKKYTRIAQILPEKIYTMNVKKIGKIRGDDCGSTNIKENNKRKQDNDQDDNISIRKNKRDRM